MVIVLFPFPQKSLENIFIYHKENVNNRSFETEGIRKLNEDLLTCKCNINLKHVLLKCGCDLSRLWY